jgi:hypothetical protein
MPLSIVSFIADAEAITAAGIGQAAEAVEGAFPGAELDLRGLERQEFRFLFAPGETPRIQPLYDELPYGAVALADLPDGTEIDAARPVAEQVHAALGAAGTVLVDNHSHYDSGADAPDWTFTVAMQKRKLDIDRDEFIDYYNGTYIPNAMKGHDNPPYETYSTAVVLDTVGEYPFDGVTLNEYATEAALRDHMTKQVAEVTSRGGSSAFVHEVEKYSGRQLQKG